MTDFFNSAGSFFESLWLDTLLPFFNNIGNGAIEIFNDIAAFFSEMMGQSDFWLYALPIVGGIILLVLILIIIKRLHYANKRRRLRKKKKEEFREEIEDQRSNTEIGVFTPQPLADIEENELLQRLLTAPELNDELRDLCRNEGAAIIFTLASAWLRIPPQIKRDLAELSQKEKWCKQYIARMDNFRYTPDYALLLWDLAPDADCLPLIADLLGSREQRVQLAAVELIGKIRDKRLIPYLIGNLLQPDKFITARVGEALQVMGIDAAQICVEMLPRVESKEALLLLEVLSLFNCDYPIENVVDCLNSPLEQIRAAAARALGEGKRTKATDRLIFALKDSSPQVRSAAVLALGQIKAKSALPYIETMLNDENWTVRVNSKKVAEILKGKK